MIYLVTGSNKGIGKEIVRELALKLAQKKEDATIYITSRVEKLGKATLEELNADLKGKIDGVTLAYHKLELGNLGDYSTIKKFLVDKHGGLDVLINNAGILSKADNVDGMHGRQRQGEFLVGAQETLKTNYFDTKSLILSLIDIIKKEGRIINVASTLGQLKCLSKELQEKFSDKNLSEENLDQLMNQFLSDVKDNSYSEKGWPKLAYSVSKVGLIAFTAILNRDRPNLFIKACCPGFCATDLNYNSGTISSNQGAQTPVSLASDDKEKFKEMFWKVNKPFEW